MEIRVMGLPLLLTTALFCSGLFAALVAKAKGMKVVSMTGAGGGKLGDLADAAIKVPETETYKIQELHLPIYHALCAAIEEVLF